MEDAPITLDEINQYNRNQYNREKNRLERQYDSDSGKDLWSQFITGMSGGGWGKSGYLDKRGFNDESEQLADNFDLSSYQDAMRQYNTNRLKDLNSGRGLFSGMGDAPGIFGKVGGFVGSLLDAPTQAVSAVRSLGKLGLSGGQDNDWNTGNKDIDRSIGSDIGAGLETAGTVLGFAPGLSGVGTKMIGGGFKAAMPAILGQAAAGATQSIGSSMRNGEDINAGDILQSMAFSTLPDVAGGLLGRGIANRAATKFGADAATALARGNKVSNAAQLLGNAGFAASAIIPAVNEANQQQASLDEMAAANGLTTDQLLYLLQYQGY